MGLVLFQFQCLISTFIDSAYNLNVFLMCYSCHSEKALLQGTRAEQRL